MTIGLWYPCGCGCGLCHRVIDDRIICSHPNFLDLLGPGELFPSDPAAMCPACVFELDEALAAAASAARRRVAAGRSLVLAGLDAAAREFAERVDYLRQVDDMLAEGAPIWRADQ